MTIKEKRGNPVSFASILMNYLEPKWVSTIYVEFRYFPILSFYNDMIDRLMDQ